MHCIKDTTGGTFTPELPRVPQQEYPDAFVPHALHGVPEQPRWCISEQRRRRLRRITDLVSDTTCLHLVGKDFCAVLLRLGLVDVLHEYTLVLENVTL